MTCPHCGRYFTISRTASKNLRNEHPDTMGPMLFRVFLKQITRDVETKFGPGHHVELESIEDQDAYEYFTLFMVTGRVLSQAGVNSLDH